MNGELWLTDGLSLSITFFVTLFTLLILIYSAGYFRHLFTARWLTLVLMTWVFSAGAAMADNILLFLLCWGILGLSLYLLIASRNTEGASLAAKKALVVIGATDALMLFGFGILWQWSGVTDPFALRFSTLQVDSWNLLTTLAYLSLMVGALAKAGAVPFHSWVPDTAEHASIPVTAYLPAALDKLLGIYFLARLSLYVYELNLPMSTLLMAIGSLTVIGAVLLALVQHDLNRLLGYHAVSQVGYMVLGVGTGNPLGIAGGLFHMFNHTIYKSCLFLCSGNVSKQFGSAEIDGLGGIGRRMPWTFGAFLISALAISGLPPLNGFFSKWMIYQGIVESGRLGQPAWVLWLVAAMFGTALTLASFMKLLHAVFLGRSQPGESEEKREVGLTLRLVPTFLAALCLVFGVFALQVPLRLPVFPSLPGEVEFTGIWSPSLAALFLAVGLLVGAGAYFLIRDKIRRVEPFVGGEQLRELPEVRVATARIYRIVEELPLLGTFYRLAITRRLDPYDVGKNVVFFMSGRLGTLHSGLLPRYVAWCLFGLVIIFYALLGGTL